VSQPASADDGGPAQFSTTRWTVVLSAAGSDSPQAEALEQLCRTYWPPLFAFLRRQGSTPHEAEDIVQGFFERFLAKDYLRDVSRDKGRFRSFLLASIRHYAANVRRDARTARRGAAMVHMNIDEPGVIARCEAALQTDPRPEVVFDSRLGRDGDGRRKRFGSVPPVELRIVAVERIVNDLRLGFTSISGQTYALQSRKDLSSGNWTTLTGSTRSGTGGILQITLSNDLIQPQQFYRVQQLP